MYDIALAAAPGALLAQTLAEGYVVQTGETLSSVVHRFFVGRLYGHKGLIERVADINPQIRNIHRIFPGMRIKLNIMDSIQGEELRQPASLAATTTSPKVRAVPSLHLRRPVQKSSATTTASGVPGIIRVEIPE